MATIERNSRSMENTLCTVLRFSGTATTTHFLKLDNINKEYISMFLLSVVIANSDEWWRNQNANRRLSGAK